jgi:glutamate-1-semialdehyde aminotransferase
MTALAHFDDEPEDYRSLLAARAANPAAQKRAERFFRILLNEGVMIGASGLFVLSTALTEADIDQVIEASLKALRTL